MKSATISELKKELSLLEQQRVEELTLRLARFKKENKELLTYLLFESHDLQGFVQQVKNEMDQEFLIMNKDTLYLAKKSLRKILRITNKYVRYTGSKEAEVELLIYFISNIHKTNIPFRSGAVISNLYDTQVKKIGKLIDSLQEDLQHDWRVELEKVMQ